MARATPTMEMFAVGAYLQLVEGCGSVTYYSELPNPKEFWLEVAGRNEAGQCVFYADFPEKFDWFPPEMRPDTLVKKLVRRYVEIAKEGSDLDYAPEHVHCQVWVPRLPARRVAEALPKVVQRLKDQHGITLEVIEPAEFARRIPLVVERALKANFDYDNLFLRALLLANGRLDYQVGAPMDQDQIEAMYRFPRTLSSAADIPAFVYHFLTSSEIVNWMGFYAPTFDDLATWLADNPHGDELRELEDALHDAGEQDQEDSEDYEEDVEPYRARRYTADELAELTRLYLAHAEPLRAEAASQRWYGPLHIEIEFMLPFLTRACERIEPSQLEREILRYGGNRDEVNAHFANDYPDKRPYRAILRVECFEPGGKRAPAYPSGKSMEVPIAEPVVADGIRCAVTINYVEDFTGYFVLTAQRLAAQLGA
ncbi:MAG: hypothetical protein FJ291_04760 [Planctomycetes bacterium]|nr:hypothetical protein [Planctomycetota bacterium]